MEKNTENRIDRKKLIAIIPAVVSVLIAVFLCIFIPNCSCACREQEVIGPTAEPTAGPTEAAETPAVTAAPTEAPTEVPTEAPTPAPTERPEPVTAEPVLGTVSVSDKLTYGCSSVGLLSYNGATYGRADCYNWRNVVSVVTTSGFTAGLTADGRVLVAGNDALAAETASWRACTALCCSEKAIYALTRFGSVVTTDTSVRGLGDTRLIAAGRDFFIAVSTEGALSAFGRAPDLAGFRGEELIMLSASGTHVVGVTCYGELVSTRPDDPFAGVGGCIRAFAGEGCTAYLTADGRLVTDCAHIIENIATVRGASLDENGFAVIENGYWFACCADHAAVLYRDGRVSAAGANDYLQCSVNNWRLLPYSSGGYVFGIAPESRGEDREPIKTGDRYTLFDGTEGVAVILGDVDMDGKVGDSDLTLLKNYLAGKASLSDAQKQAANVLRDPASPSSIDKADLEQLRYHLLGYTVIDQYLKQYAYLNEVAAAERKNTDVCGYITLAGTNISAPIMYGDNFYYHYHSWTGAANNNGSVYLYYDYPSQNTVITAHNLRKSGTMFHDLHKIQDNYAKGYGVYKNRLWTLNLFGETGVYEVFAMYEEKPSSPSGSSQYYNCCYNYTMERITEAQKKDWLRHQLERTQLSYQVAVDTHDRFVTVLTCADQHWESELGGRIYFFLRRVDGH